MTTISNNTGSWLGLDVGTRRVGVAVARADVRIPQPLTTLTNDDSLTASLQQIIRDYDVQAIIVGLPRGVNGQDTDQTAFTQAFVERIQPDLSVPIIWQDEALTSQKAEDELAARKKPFAKSDVDALAATYILEDYLNEQVRGSYV